MSSHKKEPMVQVAMHLPVALVEQVKTAARQRSIYERRHVPYVELIRTALGERFPPELDQSQTAPSAGSVQERNDD